tara:strand:+ start:639 stop:896 length:258 start_codon:yes stop_codon:yes gene_type:complete
MSNNKTTKELKKELKMLEKKIHGLKIQIQKIENKGCFSDQELNERDKKINDTNNEIISLNKEKESISLSMANIEGKKWIKKRGFQ